MRVSLYKTVAFSNSVLIENVRRTREVVYKVKGERVACMKCGYAWKLRGDNFITQCPKCRRHGVVKISELPGEIRRLKKLIQRLEWVLKEPDVSV